MSKKGENIYKRSDGRYEARYVKERDSKNRVLKYGYVYGKSYKEAKIKKEVAIKNINIEKNQDKQVREKLFSIEIEKWINNKINIKESTYYNYYSIIFSKLIPFFSNIKIKNIDEELVFKFTKKLQEDRISNKRIKDILLVLKQFFKYMKVDINIVYPKQIKNKVTSLSEDDIRIIEKNTLYSNDIKEFSILLVLYTGIRIGEMCALQWRDIDFNKGIMHISKTVVRVKAEGNNNHNKTKIIIDRPKTETSTRIVPIHNQLLKYLKRLKNDDNSFVLTGTCECLPTNIYYHYYKNFLNSLNIKEYNFHILRHTFATRALLNGIDIKTLSEILGHSSVKITLDRYVHITNEDKIYQINRLPFLGLKQSNV